MAKYKSASKLPKSPEYKQAQQSIVRGNLLGVLGNQSRLQEVLRGAFGPPKLRRGGTNAYGYAIKKPKGDAGWKNPYGY